METKKCFKCGEIKPLSDFYVHKKMGDGHLNKCKTCAKNDVKKTYEINVKNDAYVEKERLRGRLKYEKYKYKNKIRHSENRDTAKYLRRRGVCLINKEIHHWNYNLKNDVFIINPRAHKLIHKYITFDKDTNMFKDINGKIISTKEEHYQLILFVFKINSVNYEIDSYPLPF